MVFGAPFEFYWSAGGSSGLCMVLFLARGLGSAVPISSLNYPLPVLVQYNYGY